MLSRASSPRLSYIFKRDFKDNAVWLFVTSLIVLLIEPFALYITGISSQDLSNNTIWQNDLGGRFFQVSYIQQVFLGLFLILAVGFLVYRLFGFVLNKNEANLWFSLPLSRLRLFLSKYLVGLCLIAIPLILDALLMLGIFTNASPAFPAIGSEWYQSRLAFCLSLLGYYNVSILTMSLASNMADHLLAVSNLQLALPAIGGLLWAFFSEAAPGHTGSIKTGLRELILAISPTAKLFVRRGFLEFGWINLVVLFASLFLAWHAFSRRPVEAGGLKFADSRTFAWQKYSWTFLAGLLGGNFVDALFSRRQLGYFLIGFILFALFSSLVFRLFREKNNRGKLIYIFKPVMLGLIIILAFDIFSELYPVEKAKAWPLKDFDRVEVNLDDIRNSNIPWQSSPGITINVSRADDASLLENLAKDYQEKELYAQRKGLFRNAWPKPDWSAYSFESYQIQKTLNFYNIDGKRSRVNYFQSNLYLRDAFAQSAAYSNLVSDQDYDYKPGDQAYLLIELHNIPWYLRQTPDFELKVKETKDQIRDLIGKKFKLVEVSEDTRLYQDLVSRRSVSILYELDFLSLEDLSDLTSEIRMAEYTDAGDVYTESRLQVARQSYAAILEKLGLDELDNVTLNLLLARGVEVPGLKSRFNNQNYEWQEEGIPLEKFYYWDELRLSFDLNQELADFLMEAFQEVEKHD